jgi:hypothetical protein
MNYSKYIVLLAILYFIIFAIYKLNNNIMDVNDDEDIES